MTNLTAEWLGSMTTCASTSELINAYRQTKDDKKKRRLPVCCFQACFDTSVNKKGVEAMWRENHHAHLTGLVMIDVDHVDNPQTVIDGILGREDFKDLGILMIYITPSGEGFKVVFIASLPKELINFPFEAFLIYSIIRVIMRIQPMKEIPYEK